MSASDSNIDSVPYIILVTSQILVKKDNTIKSPGCTDTFYVADNKSKKPKEVVINFKSLNIKCEKICFRFNSYSICEHTVAIAEYHGVLKGQIEKYNLKKIRSVS